MMPVLLSYTDCSAACTTLAKHAQACIHDDCAELTIWPGDKWLNLQRNESALLLLCACRLTHTAQVLALVAQHHIYACVYAMQEHVYDQAKVDWLKLSCHTSIQLLQGMCTIYAQRPMFGFCEPGSDQWRTISYRQAYERVLHFAAGAWAAQLPFLPKCPHTSNSLHSARMG